MLVVLAALAAATGCTAGLRADGPSGNWYENHELNMLVETGIAMELPPPLSEEEVEVYEFKLERRRVADSVRREVQGAMAPLVLAASLFAVDGAADLLLTIVPAHKLGEAYRIGKRAMRLRRENQRARKLARLMNEFGQALPGEQSALLRLAQKLSDADRRALKSIHKHLGSEQTAYVLMRRRLANKVDLRWLARKLEKKQITTEEMRRWTFDKDLIEKFTGYDANPSWNTLQRVVEGSRVSAKARKALAGKIKGLQGERAARNLVRDELAQKYLKQSGERLDIGRGLRYGEQVAYKSLDIVTLGRGGKVLLAEVKNWNATSWGKAGFRGEVLKQLRSHNEVIEQVRRTTASREVVAKLLMVAEDGYKKGIKSDEVDVFEHAVGDLGWTIELIPNKRIGDFASFIDELR
jgi:hypothetical protein